MQICKSMLICLILFFSGLFVYAQNTSPSIQAPTPPSVQVPSVVAPVIPTLQINSVPNNATVKTTKTETGNKESIPSELSSDLTATALETLNGLFSSDEETLSALDSLGSFSSVGDLTKLLNEEINTTTDTSTHELLQEILIKLTELEAKIDNLESEKEE